MKLFHLLPGCWAMMIAAVHATPPGRDTVVLLHGLGRTSFSMAPLARSLEREGYRVVNLSYPSRTKSLEALATEWLPAELERGVGMKRSAGFQPATVNQPAGMPALQEGGAPRLHFVTHSMGGILVRLWLQEQGVPPNLGRVVMLAPPNAGSEVSDRLDSFPPLRWFTGENGRRLTTRPDALPATLGAWPPAGSQLDEAGAKRGELGVIAGSRSLNPLMSAWLPSPNDGKVTVAATHLAGETDHLVLPYSHTWLGWRSETISQVKAFLRDGRFSPAGSAPRIAGEQTSTPTSHRPENLRERR